MSKKGIIAIISGFSGAGKGTVVGELTKKYGYAVSVSATTRKPREGEEEGKSYFFKTKEEFEQMIEADELIEYARYVDNYYGTPKAYVMEQINNGKDVLLEIEMQGALKVKEKFPEVSLIFITTPSVKELRRRLEKRGTEGCDYMESYDYIVENAGLEECVASLHGLLQAIHFSQSNQKELTEKIRKDFDQYQ